MYILVHFFGLLKAAAKAIPVSGVGLDVYGRSILIILDRLILPLDHSYKRSFRR